MGPGEAHPQLSAARRLLALQPDDALLERWASAVGPVAGPFAALQRMVLELLRERPTLAGEVVERVLRSGSVTDPADLLRLQRLRAHVAKATGDLPASLDRYAAVAAGFSALGDPAEVARTVIGWSDGLALAGDVAAALALIDRTRATLQYLDPAAVARLDGTAATVHYFAGRFEPADALYRTARRRARRLGQAVDVAVCDFNLGNLELLRGRATRARAHYERARGAFEQAGLELAVQQCRYGLAATDLHRGRWPVAIAEFDRVAESLRERGDRRGAAAIDHDAAELLSSLGADPVAEVHARRARADFAAMGLGPERARAAALHARVLGRLGRIHDARRRLEEARAGFGAMGRTDALDRIDLERAHLAVRDADPAELDTELRRLARGATRRGDVASATRIRALRAELALRIDRPASALRLARRAHDDARRPDLRSLRPSLALLIARAHAHAGRGDLAVEHARGAVREFEHLVRRFGVHAESLGLGRARTELAATAIEIVLAHGGESAPRLALRMLMAVRTGSVVEDLLHGRHRSLREDLQVALARLRDRLLESGDVPGDIRASALRGEIHRLERELRGAEPARVLPGAPVLARGGPTQWVRRAGHRPLVIYERRGDTWGAFVLTTRGHVRHVELPRAAHAMTEAWIPLRMLFEALANAPAAARARLIARTTEEARAALHAVHDALWAPLGLMASEVIVVATGALNGVALEASLVEVMGEGAPLMARVPHPDLLLDRVSRAPRHALLLAGTVPGALAEIGEIAALLSTAGWSTREETTRAGFLATDRRCGLVHLATHGSFHRNRWISNGLHFHDGWLGFEQLDPRRVRGALLYFDSCESGLSNEAPGAELDGWATAGFAAGAHEMVLNLWKVDDRSAARFAREFYASWSDGCSAVVAMQRARLAARAVVGHPFEWAAGMLTSRRPFVEGPR